MDSDSRPIDLMSNDELIEYKGSLNARLEEITLPSIQSQRDKKKNGLSTERSSSPGDKTNQNEDEVVRILPKIDVQWDFVMKEMMWLAADFQSERKRQISNGKKLAGAVKQFHSTKESRRLRELAEVEAKRRRLAAKLGRDVKTWWTKIEKIISFKQKIQADQLRQKQMDKHLVYLVKQTENYSQRLNEQLSTGASEESKGGPPPASPCKNTRSKKNHPHKYIPHSTQTIEQALAGTTEKSHRSKKSKIKTKGCPKSPTRNTKLEDDTPKKSNHREIIDNASDSRSTPRKLNSIGNRRVTFAPNIDKKKDETSEENIGSHMHIRELFLNPQNDDDISDQSVDFECDENDLIDDESTLEAEEKLGREMSYQEELELLRKEAELSVDEIRAKFAPPSSYTGISDSVSEGEKSRTKDEVLDKSESFVNGEADDKQMTLKTEENVTKIKHIAEDTDQNHRDDFANRESLNSEIDKDTAIKSNESRRSKSRRKRKLPHSVTPQNVSLFQNEDDRSDDDEFYEDNNVEMDDETTIEAEERLGREMSHVEELSLLEQDSEIPIEELRAMYAKMRQHVEESQTNDEGPVSDTEHEKEVTEKQNKISESDLTLLSGNVDDNSDKEDFQPSTQLEVDDETTLDAEEKLGREMSYSEEIDMLKKEGETPIEELLAMYAKMQNSEVTNSDNYSTESSPKETNGDEKPYKHPIFDTDESDEEDEFCPSVQPPVDDETTIEAEEKLGRDMSYEEEINYLKRESEMSIEELRAMYANPDNDVSTESNTTPNDESNIEKRKKIRKRNNNRLEHHDIQNESNKKKKLNGDEDDKNLDTLNKLQASDDRIRQTTVSRPYLLSSWVKLREYQQIGLNWLVSIQSRRLNGILADEMGLGKTLQTITLLSYLASYKGIWGPHLIIVPTSCIVNWEVELKRFCPSFKVLCYHGSAKRRKELRQGWTKSNWYHVVITSYQLAVQDAFAFKRKRWYYLVLDEAQNIKNFQSQRWQTLITFNTQRRLLLTGTPLQNNLMELWSLLHFLMPHIFRSRKEFSYWFSNPMSHIIEGNANRNDDLISRLHGIIRPFVLRRLKKDVETQMPGKYEHVVSCQLSRRQMFLYEEFISRSSTRMALKKGGNFMGMMNVLMQLRKVCNHPDLFEPRSVITPFCMEPLSFTAPGCVISANEPKSSLDKVSDHWMHPLWSVRSGITSFNESISHDSISAEQLARLEMNANEMLKILDDECVREPKPDKNKKPELFNVLTSIWNTAKSEKEHVIRRNSNINKQRCQTSQFPYPDSLIQKFLINISPLHQTNHEFDQKFSIASTPKELLQMRKSQTERAKDMDDIISKFVFCVPRAGSRKPVLDANAIDLKSVMNESRLTTHLMTPIESHFLPYRKANARLSSFFPDKKLIQFDAGKLQTLSVLLRDLKQGGHRCLIFTQMSKMLDILEAFLNLNGHTYVRLDGSTGIDSRQRLMDRFNNDTKIFSFILSTRSGGLGINLTGADTVIFYDSDWNPAMDAQAQDRAHRIGQTRDVHIYRLVTQHTIEENILIKAKQKRQLDYLVMDEGKFSATESTRNSDASKLEGQQLEDNANTNVSEVFTKEGLRDILGVKTIDDDSSVGVSIQSTKNSEEMNEADSEPILSKEQMENAMAVLEDEDDVQAMRGAQKEAAEELREFDEIDNDVENDSQSLVSRDDDTIDDEQSRQSFGSADNKSVGKKTLTKKKPKSAIEPNSKKEKDEADANPNDADMEKEFAAWQSKVGIDIDTITSSLKPTEQYGLQFRENIDPFYSIHYDEIESQLMEDEAGTGEGEFDVNEIEEQKEAEERRVMEEGDLLATNPLPETLPELRQMYLQEKASLRAKKKRRKLTGENWSTKIDGMTKLPFWYNEDTGEAIWEKPTVLLELEAEKTALEKKWSAMSAKPLLYIMSFLVPYPDRINCSKVCRSWRSAASDISFVKHVYPVEMGALTMDPKKLDIGHFRSITEALAAALPGDTIELGDGHYWIHEPGICVEFPLRILGDENDPSHVVLELSGTVTWKGCGGWMEGVTIRRPKMASEKGVGKEVFRMEGRGKIDMAYCVLDNEGGNENVALVSGNGHKGTWYDVSIKNSTQNKCGLRIEGDTILTLEKCKIINNGGDGMSCTNISVVNLSNCKINGNKGYGISLDQKSCVKLEDSVISGNEKGVIQSSDNISHTLKDISSKIKKIVLDLSGKSIMLEEVPSTGPRTRTHSGLKRQATSFTKANETNDSSAEIKSEKNTETKVKTDLVTSNKIDLDKVT